MNSQSKLLAIELNREFVELLRANTNDPRLKVANGSAVEVRDWIGRHRLPLADFILSGIPYTVLPGSVRQKILSATRDALAADGVFIVYQYTRAVLPDLRQVFGSVEEDFEPMNILPARLFYCRK
jgi:phospholipid N-methyltransferase